MNLLFKQKLKVQGERQLHSFPVVRRQENEGTTESGRGRLDSGIAEKPGKCGISEFKKRACFKENGAFDCVKCWRERSIEFGNMEVLGNFVKSRFRALWEWKPDLECSREYECEITEGEIVSVDNPLDLFYYEGDL